MLCDRKEEESMEFGFRFGSFWVRERSGHGLMESELFKNIESDITMS
jgi:hypothetical protein